MSQDLNIISLFIHASWVVKIVVLLLLGVSIVSWAAIFRKIFALKKVNSLNDDFERDFWSGKSLNELFAAATQNAKLAGPMERIFASGMREFLKLREKRLDSGAQLDGARRAMRASFQREMDVIESHLSFLASVASVSPYVGLFGTVWGILRAFRDMANNGQGGFTVVAAGISEALVTTAGGILVAVEAVVLYNYFQTRAARAGVELKLVADEFVELLRERPTTAPAPAPTPLEQKPAA